jgi:ADP-heptose:LPS heptosyltransferase
MNTRKKILIDKSIVKFLIYFLNIFVRIAGKLLRIDHCLEKDFKTIAIAKYKGLGSIIQSTPLLQTLRLKYPKAKIVFVTTSSNVAILQKINCIDEIVFIDDKNIQSLLKTFLPFIIRLISLRIELYLDLEIYSNFSSLITTLSMAKNRAGYFLRSSNYRMGIYTHMLYYNIRVPVAQTYLQFSRLLNCNIIIEDLFRLEGIESEVELNGKMIKFKENKYILINPNASDLRLERRWDIAKYAGLIKSLQVKYPSMDIFLMGSKEETEYVNQLYFRLEDTKNVKNFAGKTNMDQLLSLVKHASVFITNDTGPMHIGFSVNTRIVALFGPCSPEQYGRNKNCYSIYNKVYCSPCVHEFMIPPCGGDNQCMKLIEIEVVLKGADIMLNHDLLKDSSYPELNNIYEIKDEKGKKIPLGFIRRDDNY